MRERSLRGIRRKPRRCPLHVCLLLLFLSVAAVWFFVVSAPPRSLDGPAQPELHLNNDVSLREPESSPLPLDEGTLQEQSAEADTGDEEEVENGGGRETTEGRAGEEEEEEEKEEEEEEEEEEEDKQVAVAGEEGEQGGRGSRACATVEEMGEEFSNGSEKESLRVRELIRHHFIVHGAATVRGLPPDQFCKHGFVMGKASEAGFGNEMYKILTSAALSIMLNRSLIIGQSRGLFPFGDYITYTNSSFTLKEVKHLWKKNKCLEKYGRPLKVRTDDFGKPAETNVLCSDWRKWKHPIIWFQSATDAVACQFFLKNINAGMKNAALSLFGDPGSLHSRPNVFGELMRILISPSKAITEAVNVVLKGGIEPDVALHMRMMSNRSVRALKAALHCIHKAVSINRQKRLTKPRVVLISDTPSFIKDITPSLRNFEILHFDYRSFEGNISNGSLKLQQQSGLRAKDWGPAPRWVAFVDFFLASHAKHAVISGAHRRVGTTYAQLLAALAAASHLGEDASSTFSFSFFSSFQRSRLAEGLANQIGWGHSWNRFAGPLSCPRQSQQCAFTPLLPSAWWDGRWQSPIPRDIRRMKDYGVHLTDTGEVVESSLRSFCERRKETVRILPIISL